MNLFFLSIGLIVSGGISVLILWHQFTLMKSVGVLGISAGCFLGLIDAISKLFNPESYAFSFNYLNVLSLSFKIDGLAAFFLVAIFAVSLLAAIYSFHYMNKPEKALRTSVNYLFFSLLVASMALVVTAGNMIAFMLSWEVMSLSSFFLVIYDHQSPENRKAGYLYFVFSHVGAMFIFAAFGVMYGYTGSFGFDAALPETANRSARPADIILVIVPAFAESIFVASGTPLAKVNTNR